MRNNHDDVLPWPVARKRAYEHAGRGLEIDPEAPLPFSVLAVLQVVDGRHEEESESRPSNWGARSAAHYRRSKPSDEDDLVFFRFLPVE